MEVVTNIRRYLLQSLLKEGLQLRFGLLNAHSGSEPGKGPSWASQAAVRCAVDCFVCSPWKEHIGGLESGHLKAFGQHPDYAGRVAVDVNCFVQDVLVQAIVIEPKAVGDESYLGPVGTIFFR